MYSILPPVARRHKSVSRFILLVLSLYLSFMTFAKAEVAVAPADGLIIFINSAVTTSNDGVTTFHGQEIELFHFDSTGNLLLSTPLWLGPMERSYYLPYQTGGSVVIVSPQPVLLLIGNPRSIRKENYYRD